MIRVLMKKTCLAFAPAMLLVLIVLSQTSWAVKAYITDRHDVALRSGPATQNKIITTMASGAAVEIVKIRGEWSRIRYTEPSGGVKEGWVQTKILGSHPSEGSQIKQLEDENDALRERATALEKEKNEASQREQDAVEKLRKLEAGYEALKSGSANYLKLKDQNDSVNATLMSAQEDVQRLIRENENLKLSQNIKWFIIGAAVLVVGWLIGLVTGRYQRRRRSVYNSGPLR